MIPQASVDTAARIIYRTSGRKRVMSYEQARPTCEEEARLILEAAAPHMLADAKADAWDEGWDKFAGFDSRPASPYPANPYRSQA